MLAVAVKEYLHMEETPQTDLLLVNLSAPNEKGIRKQYLDVSSFNKNYD